MDAKNLQVVWIADISVQKVLEEVSVVCTVQQESQSGPLFLASTDAIVL